MCNKCNRCATCFCNFRAYFVPAKLGLLLWLLDGASSARSAFQERMTRHSRQKLKYILMIKIRRNMTVRELNAKRYYTMCSRTQTTVERRGSVGGAAAKRERRKAQWPMAGRALHHVRPDGHQSLACSTILPQRRSFQMKRTVRIGAPVAQCCV